ncbi:MAG: thioesterase [Alphaproteobacteria bacterium]|nr:thioesterase [Alphaproteobacteria bacterium]
MKPTLQAGLKHRFAYKVPEEKTVPHLYREALELQIMPEVFATGFMVGLMEWTCVQLLAPHLDEGEGSLGTHIDVSHKAATPVGMTVTVDAECIEARGPRVRFKLTAHDGVDEIGSGTHERFIVFWDRFNRRVAEKAGATS